MTSATLSRGSYTYTNCALVASVALLGVPPAGVAALKKTLWHAMEPRKCKVALLGKRTSTTIQAPLLVPDLDAITTL